MKIISSIQLETPKIDSCWADEMKNLNKTAGHDLRLDFRPQGEQMSAE